ncbi:histidine phosphatase family protein [Chiayiivirga flava]|uniref:Serine/threonine-protein phosphatase PGAM5 n=1 Tax=Chiayiivirga flava TaxID=659595 RepID=A0A7W8D2U2_9GAMM|nr:histidine phosphatase family protein [Chiayiivirga flava]MBB5206854.1 serine/threonine-protein phosphatase PGAM5 [Chiayiivirga flava]
MHTSTASRFAPLLRRIAVLAVALVATNIGARDITAKDAAPALREIILVRHGHYAADPSIDARIGPGLSPLGVAQAHLVGARIHADVPRIDGLHVSPMQRARDTAASIGALFPERSFEVLPDLAECTPPTRRKDITAQESPESLAACKAQLDRLFERHFATPGPAGRTDLFVCHGNVIRYLVMRALGVDSEAWLELSIGHASVTRIRVEADGRYKVIAVGDVGHLPTHLRTGASGDPERDLAVDSLRTAPAPAVPSRIE